MSDVVLVSVGIIYVIVEILFSSSLFSGEIVRACSTCYMVQKGVRIFLSGASLFCGTYVYVLYMNRCHKPVFPLLE